MVVKNEKFVSIQALRILAASAVILAHIKSNFTGTLSESDSLWHYLNFGAVGVDLFFVISGFVMVYASEQFFAQPHGSLRFFYRRLLRIIPLYWICTTFELLFIIYIHDGITVDDLSYSSIFGSYLFIPIPRPSGINAPILGVGWSLNLEMMFYVVFACAIILPRRYAVMAASLMLTGLVFAVGDTSSKILGFYNNVRIYQFILGMGIGLIYRKGIRLSLLQSGFLLGFGVLLFINAHNLLLYWDHFSNPYCWACAVTAFVAACVLSTRTVRQTLFTKTILLLGDASYALYLTHSITFTLLKLYFRNFAKILTGPISLCTLPLLVCIAVAVITHICVEKPITRLLQRISKPRSTSEGGASIMEALHKPEIIASSIPATGAIEANAN